MLLLVGDVLRRRCEAKRVADFASFPKHFSAASQLAGANAVSVFNNFPSGQSCSCCRCEGATADHLKTMHHVTHGGWGDIIVGVATGGGWQEQNWVAVPRVGLDSDVIGAGGGPGVWLWLVFRYIITYSSLRVAVQTHVSTV